MIKSLTGKIKAANSMYTFILQEAPLLQRGRGMLRVIEYFAKLPKVTQSHSQ